jgi:hypothetical protein
MDIRNNSIFIPGDTPSSKNNQVWSEERGALFAGPKTQRWRRYTKKIFESNREAFIKHLQLARRPYCIEFTFVRDRDAAFDYINAAQAVQDAMSTYGWIDDDSCYDMKPYFGDYQVNRKNPGVYIRVLKEKPIHGLEVNKLNALLLNTKAAILIRDAEKATKLIEEALKLFNENI